MSDQRTIREMIDDLLTHSTAFARLASQGQRPYLELRQSLAASINEVHEWLQNDVRVEWQDGELVRKRIE